MAKKKAPVEEQQAKREKGPLAAPHLAYLLLEKVVNATRAKVKLSDRDQYKAQLPVGTHRLQGMLEFDVTYSVGADSTSARSYGVPLDAVILLALLHAGAMREHFIRSALIVREIRTAELEDRRVRGIRYAYDDVAKDGTVTRRIVRVKSTEVAHEAMRLGLKLAGDWPGLEDKPQEAAYRRAMAEQIASLAAQIKVDRPYDGPINLIDVAMKVLEKKAKAA